MRGVRAAGWGGAAATALVMTVLAGDAAARHRLRRTPSVELPAVTVTARKRDEVEQSVPIGMSVLEGPKLDIAPNASNAGLARSAPNVNFVDVGGQASNLFSVRGVGSFAPISADDTSTVLYVNEAPLSVYGAAPSMLDVDRVEVLRGPQGTLFGRNTQAGAISIVTNGPTFDRLFSLRGEAGTQAFGLGEFVWNQPLVADLAPRCAWRCAIRPMAATFPTSPPAARMQARTSGPDEARCCSRPAARRRRP